MSNNKHVKSRFFYTIYRDWNKNSDKLNSICTYRNDFNQYKSYGWISLRP